MPRKARSARRSPSGSGLAQGGPPRPARRCMFCTGRRLTLEHAIPEWVLRRLGILGGKTKGTMEARVGAEEQRRVWAGAEIKTRHVCGACNGGWMSDLENRVQRLVAPLLVDLAVPLDASEQAALARWAIKTAIVLEATGPQDHESLYTAPDRDRVRASEAPPPGTVVWVGRAASDRDLFVSGRRLLQPMAVRPSRSPFPLEAGYATTLGLGRLVMQVLRLRLAADSATPSLTIYPRPGPWHELLLQISPQRRSLVQWPPRATFSDAGVTLDDLCRRFANPP